MWEETLPNSFYKANITVILKSDGDRIKKNKTLIFYMKKKISTKYLKTELRTTLRNPGMVLCTNAIPTRVWERQENHLLPLEASLRPTWAT